MRSDRSIITSDPSVITSAHSVIIGADAGGSTLEVKCLIGSETFSTTTTSVNVRNIDPKAFAIHVAETIEKLLPVGARKDRIQFCLGAAGAGSSSFQDALSRMLIDRWGVTADRILVVTDARIALEAAFGSSPGIIVIAGTGSGCYGFSPGGDLIRAGGWGAEIGDPGSGTAIGFDAVRGLLTELETQDLTPLGISTAVELKLPNPTVALVLEAVYASDLRVASLAPLVLKLLGSGDRVAESIVAKQCAQLAGQCLRLAQRVPPVAQHIALIGGLTRSDSFVSLLSDALRKVLPDASVKRSHREPVEGAIDLARRL